MSKRTLHAYIVTEDERLQSQYLTYGSINDADGIEVNLHCDETHSIVRIKPGVMSGWQVTVYDVTSGLAIAEVFIPAKPLLR